MLKENVFEKIISGEIPAQKVLETPDILAFHDIAPKAKVHILIIPKMHLTTAQEVSVENTELFGRLFLVAKQVAENLGLKGYKLHMNVGDEGGQVVPHVHLHLLSGDFKTSL